MPKQPFFLSKEEGDLEEKTLFLKKLKTAKDEQKER
jgi:hypothetical protein